MATLRRSHGSAKMLLFPLFLFVHRTLELGETQMLEHVGEEKEGIRWRGSD